MTQIQVSQVSFGFGGRPPRQVLNQISFSPRPGSFTAILGPNGAGKTTLLRLMLGLLTPTSGQITVDGTRLADLTARQRAHRLAYIPQRSTVAFPYTVRQVVAMGRYAASTSRQDPAPVDRAIRAVGLEDRADEPIGVLSAGQQQRATLARALAQIEGHDSPLILADEPVSAMDPAHAISAMSVLTDLARRGSAVVVVLHDLNLAARWAQDALVMRATDSGGSAVAFGAIADVLVPEVLSPVFGVDFERVARADGSHVLIPLQRHPAPAAGPAAGLAPLVPAAN